MVSFWTPEDGVFLQSQSSSSPRESTTLSQMLSDIMDEGLAEAKAGSVPLMPSAAMGGAIPNIDDESDDLMHMVSGLDVAVCKRGAE